MIKSIELEKIVSDDNRKYTKDDGFAQLVESVKQFGIIEQPVVRALGDGSYKVIAGRRRIAAAKKLGITETECSVCGEGDDGIAGSDEEIALAENVNRLEMHPLDEAALFSGMAAKGMSVEKIAKYYARSPSAIYRRLRLVNLIEELKGIFRDGWLDIEGAAMLADLPEDDQRDFFKSNYNKDFEEKINNINIVQFVQKKQKNVIEDSMKKACKGCAKRTHNEDDALFEGLEEDDYFNDVCLDGECYRAKWANMVRAALEKVAVQMEEAGVQTDFRIYFQGGAPEKIYKNASKVEFNIKKEGVVFEVIRDKAFEFAGETQRKKDACWWILTNTDGNIDVRRVGYKARPPKEKPEAAGSGAGKGADKELKRTIELYGREAMEAAAKELQIPSAAELVKKLQGKNVTPSEIEDEISDLVIERVIARNMGLDSGNARVHDYLGMFLEAAGDELFCNEHGFDEKRFDDEQKKWLKELYGSVRSMKSISEELDEDAQKLFHFLFLTIGFRSATTPDELSRDDLFFRYAGMSVEEYKALYLEAAKEVAKKALAPKGKKGGKKAAVVKKKAAEPDDEEDEDNYPFEPDPYEGEA